MADMILMAEGICKKYRRPTKMASHFEAVKTLDFSLKKGKLVEICGRSGSGKSTLLYMMAGLLKPTGGRILALGFDSISKEIDLFSLSDEKLSRFRNSHFGVIPQGQTGLYSLTVMQNILVPLSVYGDSKAYEERAKELLELVGIPHLADSRMQELSGGEMRRMAVARALVSDSDFIFADEPTDDLDDENTKTVLELLRKIADSGKGVLLVSHESSAKEFADEVYKMDAGSLLKNQVSPIL